MHCVLIAMVRLLASVEADARYLDVHFGAFVIVLA